MIGEVEISPDHDLLATVIGWPEALGLDAMEYGVLCVMARLVDYPTNLANLDLSLRQSHLLLHDCLKYDCILR